MIYDKRITDPVNVTYMFISPSGCQTQRKWTYINKYTLKLLLEFRIEQTITIDLERVYLNKHRIIIF